MFPVEPMPAVRHLGTRGVLTKAQVVFEATHRHQRRRGRPGLGEFDAVLVDADALGLGVLEFAEDVL